MVASPNETPLRRPNSSGDGGDRRSVGPFWPKQPLPVADGLLAATAHEHDLTIATRNGTDFERAGVRLVNPFR